MKKNVFKMFLLVAFVTLISCGKDSDSIKPNENGSTNSVKLIKSIKISGGQEKLKDVVINYTYDTDNKIIKIANELDVSYQNNKIGIEKLKITATTNDKGNVTHLTRTESRDKNYEYQYNTANQLIQETKKANQGTIDTDEVYAYHWENENLVIMGDKNDPSVRVEYGKDTNKNNFSLVLSRFSYHKMLFYLPFPMGKASKMLPVKAFSSEYSYHYEYTLDNEGYVTKIIERYENTRSKENYITTFEISY
ncbi:hypothetical protein [Capnocytophaga sp.]|uniref:hypothetical protein n=1 Tax=Capnocytophaga sp. TaxID=44737 RepID=UPI0026DC5C47|nr:hypothetical protein [Capnocytophaga sp.]MDO5105645.1 hypothetical protein [Capnocytophaga sp.]